MGCSFRKSSLTQLFPGFFDAFSLNRGNADLDAFLGARVGTGAMNEPARFEDFCRGDELTELLNDDRCGLMAVVGANPVDHSFQLIDRLVPKPRTDLISFDAFERPDEVKIGLHLVDWREVTDQELDVLLDDAFHVENDDRFLKEVKPLLQKLALEDQFGSVVNLLLHPVGHGVTGSLLKSTEAVGTADGDNVEVVLNR
jgi:hypothetical protein